MFRLEFRFVVKAPVHELTAQRLDCAFDALPVGRPLRMRATGQKDGQPIIASIEGQTRMSQEAGNPLLAPILHGTSPNAYGGRGDFRLK